MGKLFNLKQWLTVDDAAKHLSIVFGENVSVADVLRLALDQELTLSVNFVNGAHGRAGLLVPLNEATYEEVTVLPGMPVRVYGGPRISTDGEESHILQLETCVVALSGIWDLPMIGGERLAVERLYQRLTGGPDATNQPMDGAFVQSSDGLIYQLQVDFDDNEYCSGSAASLESIRRVIETQNMSTVDKEKLLNQHNEDRKKFLEDRKSKPETESFYPGGDLPEDAVFVVRVDALRDLENTVNGETGNADKPMATIERNSLLTIIAVLCEDKKYDYNKAAKTAGLILGTASKMGISIGESTIEKHLKRIPDALGTRMK